MVSIPLFQDWTFKERRRILLICFSLFMLLLQANYSIIIPSIWFYLDYLKADYWFVGVTISLSACSSALASPILGYVADNTRRIRLLLVAGSFVFFLGNLTYSISVSRYFALIGGIIAGLSGGLAAVPYGEIARISTKAQRTAHVAFLDASRVVGFLIGPCINIMLAGCEFSLGKWRIFSSNCPTVLVALLWLVFSLALFICMPVITEVIETSETMRFVKVNMHIPGMGGDEDTEDEMVGVDDDDDEEDKKSGIGDIFDMGDDSNSEDEIELPMMLRKGPKNEGVVSLIRDMMRGVFLVLMWLSFFECFILGASLTVGPLLAKERMGWGQWAVYVLILGSAIIFLLSSFSVGAASKWFADRHTLLFAVGLQTCTLPLFFLLEYFRDTFSLTIVFLGLTFLISVNAPCFLIPIRSLVSKVCHEEKLSLFQGLFITINSCAIIISPLITAGLYGYFLHFSVMVNVVNIATFIAYLAIYKQLRV